MTALVTLSSLGLALPNNISHPNTRRVSEYRLGTPVGPSGTTTPALATKPHPGHPVRADGFLVGTRAVELTVPAPAGQATPVAMRTDIWYPATTKGGKLTPDRAAAPYPLIVFSQGFDLAVSAYAGLLDRWASAGFIVAAPTYPYTAPPAPLDEADILNHPAELRSVITALTGGLYGVGTSLSGLVSKSEVGIAGQSDGGEVSLVTGFNTCCYDPAVRAVAVLSGAELSSFGGTYFAGPRIPLLVVQGTADIVNAPGCSAELYDGAKGSKWYVDLLGAGHLGPYSAVTVPAAGPPTHSDALYRRVVAAVTTNFFQAELLAQPPGISAITHRLATVGDIPGVAQVTSGPRAPITASYCPGAPG
jgi:hypothetical protein